MVGILTPPECQSAYLLVVEDHEPMRQRLVQWLEIGFPGLAVHGVESGESALAFVERGLPVAAVIDVGLPGMDGIATTRHLRSLSPLLPVIVISMNNSLFYEAEALEAGAFRFVTKSEAAYRLVPELLGGLGSGNS